jgi:hypothetical protein
MFCETPKTMKRLVRVASLRLGLPDPSSSFRQGFWAGIQAVGRRSGFRPEARRNDEEELMEDSIDRPFFRAVAHDPTGHPKTHEKTLSAFNPQRVTRNFSRQSSLRKRRSNSRRPLRLDMPCQNRTFLTLTGIVQTFAPGKGEAESSICARHFTFPLESCLLRKVGCWALRVTG